MGFIQNKANEFISWCNVQKFENQYLFVRFSNFAIKKKKNHPDLWDVGVGLHVREKRLNLTR